MSDEITSMDEAEIAMLYHLRDALQAENARLREQAEALAGALDELQAVVQATCEGGYVDMSGIEILGEALEEADAALRAYREATQWLNRMTPNLSTVTVAQRSVPTFGAIATSQRECTSGTNDTRMSTTKFVSPVSRESTEPIRRPAMTPDEALKDCRLCGIAANRKSPYHQGYHHGYEDGYEAAQRERGPIQAVGKPLPTHAEWCTGPVGYGGVGACPCDPIATTAIHRLYASETPQGRPGS